MSGPHSHDPHQPASPRVRRFALALLVPVAVLTLVGLVLLWPEGDSPQASDDGATRLTGQVLAVRTTACPEMPEGLDLPPGAVPDRCGTVTVKLTDGPDTGQEITADLPGGPGAITVDPGDEVVLLYLPDSLTGQPYSIVDHQRGTQLWLLGAAFALAVIAFGRWRGLTALAGLGVTFAVLLLFIVPAILDGSSPLLVAVVGSAAIMLIVLYLTHGFSLTTTVAVVGTLVSLTITAGLSALATAATHLSGTADETSSYLDLTNGEVNMRGLLLAGIVIGSLGVLDDVTVTQAAMVAELSRANPAYRFRQLYSAATRIGRAHIASVINTIVLAYAGASLPLLLLFAAGDSPVGEVLTSQLIAQELVRSVVGTLGLIAAVPVTTALAAAVAAHRAGPGTADRAGVSDAGSEPADRSVPPQRPADRFVPPQRPAEDHRRPPDDPWMAFVDRDRTEA